MNGIASAAASAQSSGHEQSLQDAALMAAAYNVQSQAAQHQLQQQQEAFFRSPTAQMMANSSFPSTSATAGFPSTVRDHSALNVHSSPYAMLRNFSPGEILSFHCR
jgi:hypothetical protein